MSNWFRWSCGCKMSGNLRLYCNQHEDWKCHGGETDHLQPTYQPNLGECPLCYFSGLRSIHHKPSFDK